MVFVINGLLSFQMEVKGTLDNFLKPEGGAIILIGRNVPCRNTIYYDVHQQEPFKAPQQIHLPTLWWNRL